MNADLRTVDAGLIQRFTRPLYMRGVGLDDQKAEDRRHDDPGQGFRGRLVRKLTARLRGGPRKRFSRAESGGRRRLRGILDHDGLFHRDDDAYWLDDLAPAEESNAPQSVLDLRHRKHHRAIIHE